MLLSSKTGGRPNWTAVRLGVTIFEYPARRGGYRLRVNDREAVVGFHGSFYADPVTLDVRRMEVVAEDIPAELRRIWMRKPPSTMAGSASATKSFSCRWKASS